MGSYNGMEVVFFEISGHAPQDGKLFEAKIWKPCFGRLKPEL